MPCLPRELQHVQSCTEANVKCLRTGESPATPSLALPLLHVGGTLLFCTTSPAMFLVSSLLVLSRPRILPEERCMASQSFASGVLRRLRPWDLTALLAYIVSGVPRFGAYRVVTRIFSRHKYRWALTNNVDTTVGKYRLCRRLQQLQCFM